MKNSNTSFSCFEFFQCLIITRPQSLQTLKFYSVFGSFYMNHILEAMCAISLKETDISSKIFLQQKQPSNNWLQPDSSAGIKPPQRELKFCTTEALRTSIKKNICIFIHHQYNPDMSLQVRREHWHFMQLKFPHRHLEKNQQDRYQSQYFSS